MQLSDLISSEKLDAMREIASKPSDASIYAPFLSDEARGFICELVGRKCGTAFWMSLRSEYNHAPNVIVCVSGKRANVMQVTKSVTFAKHLGMMLKRGDKLCWIENGYHCEISWENWKSVYKWLTSTEAHEDLPVPPSRYEMRLIREKIDRDAFFYDMASVVRNKKLNKRGYNMSFDEIRAQMRHDAYEKRLRGVEMEARKILSVL